MSTTVTSLLDLHVWNAYLGPLALFYTALKPCAFKIVTKVYQLVNLIYHSNTLSLSLSLGVFVSFANASACACACRKIDIQYLSCNTSSVCSGYGGGGY